LLSGSSSFVLLTFLVGKPLAADNQVGIAEDIATAGIHLVDIVASKEDSAAIVEARTEPGCIEEAPHQHASVLPAKGSSEILFKGLP